MVTPTAKTPEKAYLYHRAGSKKNRVHQVFDEQGEAAASALARKLGIKTSSMKRWKSDWLGGGYHKERLAAMSGTSKKAREERAHADIAKIFMNGRSQAVRLPKAFRLPGVRVRVRRDGDAIVLEPLDRNMKDVFAEIDRLAQGRFMEGGRDQPPMPPDDDVDSFD
jgi:antitoxin VapB